MLVIPVQRRDQTSTDLDALSASDETPVAEQREQAFRVLRFFGSNRANSANGL